MARLRDPSSSRPAAEVIDAVKRRLAGYFEAAEDAFEDASTRPMHAYRLGHYLFTRRNELAHAAALISQGPERASQVVRDVELTSLREPDRFAQVEGRSDLLRAWTALLVESADRVASEEHWGDIYATTADADDEFAEASAAEAGQSWQDES
jgi:hypothetical protein